MATPLPSGVIPQCITSANGYLFISGDDTNLYRISESEPVVAGSATLLCSLGVVAYQMIVANDVLYASNPDEGTIYQVNLGTNTATTFISGLASPRGIAVVSGYLYTIDQFSPLNNYIYKMAISNPNLSVSVDCGSNLSHAGRMTTDGQYLYIINSYYAPTGAYISRQDLSDFTSNGFIGVWRNFLATDLPDLFGIGNVIVYMNPNIYFMYFPNDVISNIVELTPSGNILSTNYIPDICSTNTSLNQYITSLDVSGSQFYATFNNDTGTPYYIINGLTAEGGGGVNIPCFNTDTLILTDRGYLPIQYLKKGDGVKTLKHDFVPIHMIGKKEMHHVASSQRIKNQLYKCSQEQYPEIIQDLILTGCHCIIVPEFASPEQREEAIRIHDGQIYVTDHHYRLPACADDRATIFPDAGAYTIYHLALENEDYYMNYGIYANGLLVETCSKRYLKELSGMHLI